MSVEQKGVIDFASIDTNGNAILTISDHLPWDEEEEHILILQTKINSYLGAIESGELFDKYPIAQNRKIVIQIFALHSPNGAGEKFLQKVNEILTSAGYSFEFKQQSSG